MDINKEFEKFVEEKNQQKNGIEFKKLIESIIKRWPEVEFMHTMSLDKIIRKQHE